MLKQFVLLVALIAAVSCGETENNNEQIHGNWHAISWTAAGIETLEQGASVTFEFNDDDTYAAKSGATMQEEGIYRLSGTKLYTTAKGQIEKMVEVELSGTDTLMMNMNRSGTAETMILVKSE